MRHAFAIGLYAIVCVAVLGWYTILEPFGRDQGIHATIAFALDEGLITYRDVYNIKPPMTTVAHWLALGLFGHSMMAIRIFDLAVVAIVCIVFARVLRGLGIGRAGEVFAVFALAATYFSIGFWNRAQTDGWAGFLTVICLAVLLRAWRRGGRDRDVLMFGAGALLALAFLFKYTVAGFGLMVLAPLGLPDTGRRRILHDLAWFLSGGTVVGIACLMALTGSGALMPFLDIQLYIRGYTAYGSGDRHALGTIDFFLRHNLGVKLAALLGTGFLLTRERLKHNRLPTIVMAIWLFTAWLSGYAQGRNFYYHFLPVIPPLCGLAAFAFDQAWVWLRSRAPGPIGWVTGTSLGLVLAFPLVPLAMTILMTAQLARHATLSDVWAGRYELSDFSIDETMATSRALDELRQPGDSIFVWGYETTLYFLQGVPPRHRFPYAWPLVVDFSDGRYVPELMTRLRSDPPQFFIVQDDDATSHVTGHEFTSKEMLSRIAPLHDFVTNTYTLERQVGRYDIWRRVK
jgi:hypothetical protein